MSRIIGFFLLLSCFNFIRAQDIIYDSDQLQIKQLSKNSYLHISYLETEKWGRVGCNGLVVVSKNESVVFDTPINEMASTELISWLTDSLQTRIKQVVVNHHHVDCLGGLSIFHQKDIPSVSSSITRKLALEKGNPVPERGFLEKEVFTIGSLTIINQRFGASHAPGCIFSYIKEDQVLFGGCGIKALGAGKGNLADANVNAWSETVSKAKNEFTRIRTVIPGHGKHGGVELLDYTIEMFKH